MSKHSRRTRIANQQGGRCYYCNDPMNVRPLPDDREPNKDDATIEHLVPRILGGTSTIENIVVACYWCNKVGARIDLWAAKVFGGHADSSPTGKVDA